jgi:leucyl-tRNA synthetase
MPRYNPAAIEPKWQRYWEEQETFKTPEMPAGRKLYVLDMFPYPSGQGLHVGHPEGYTATDIVCRFERMRGATVLHPMGFDAFGLPAEEYAIKTNTPPRVSTEKNIATFTSQLKMLGFSYDWNRVLSTTDVEYFKWTQWIFLVLFDTWYDPEQQKGRPISELPIPDEVKKQGETAIAKYRDEFRLAYQSDALVNWCPALGTVLANEEVIDGKSERGGHPVVRQPLRQWMLRITAYADRLEKDLAGLDWSEGIKKLQRDWIGRSTGAEVDFFVGLPFEVENGVPMRDAFEMWKDIRVKGIPGLDAHPVAAKRRTDRGEKFTFDFSRRPHDDVLRIYTTRPDTLFGATYMVIAPEHPFVARLTTPAQKAAVEAYVQKAAAKSDRDRQDVNKQKTGVFTGSYAINPVNGQPTPIWIADYVLISYGTGAIMAVPAHDERDFEFAQQYSIPIKAVVDPGLAFEGGVRGFKNKEEAEKMFDDQVKQYGAWRNSVLAGEVVFADHGTAVNSEHYDGLTTAAFKAKITADLAAAGLGREAVNYKLRDWLFSRQRFWGEPFPILHELDASGKPTGVLRAVDPKDLPVDLPHLDDYKPIGKPEPPLGKAPESWLYPVIDGKRYRRETNTMPQWAGSCWYYLRFIDPRNGQAFVDRAKEKAWMPVDLYVGGAEHAVLHLLYSRFWHKVLFDRGHVSTAEPFQKLVNQGMILGEPQHHVTEAVYEQHKTTFAERGLRVRRVDDDGEVTYVVGVPGEKDDELKNLAENQAEKRQGQIYLAGTQIPMTARADKMSKARGNVVNPNDIVAQFGADALRLYEMFMGPLEEVKPWSTQSVSGVRNFLDRAWRLIVDDRLDEPALNPSVKDVEPNEEQNRTLHRTIEGVTRDIERMAFNTAIAKLMEFVNFFTKETVRPKRVLEQFVLLLAPLAPHIGEELWQILGHRKTLAYEAWPVHDPNLTKADTIEIPVQVNGKLRAKISVAAESDEAAVLTAAKADDKIAEMLAGKSIAKQIYVPKKLVNFVVK